MLFLLLQLVQVANAQFRENSAGPERFIQRFSEAAADVVDWYDTPIYLIYLIDKYDILPRDGKPIVLTPSAAEQALARNLAVPGGNSPGSIDPFTIPNMILGARALHCIGSELLDDDADTRPAMRHALGMYKALVYTQVSTQFAKNFVHRVRPDNTDDKSFFSGHTSTTFAMASYLQREFDQALRSSSLLTDHPFLRNGLRAAAFTVTYGWAGYVGYSRMRDNRHYFSDVLVGAVIGTLIGNVVYDEIMQEDDSVLHSLSLIAGSDGPQFSLQLNF